MAFAGRTATVPRASGCDTVACPGTAYRLYSTPVMRPDVVNLSFEATHWVRTSTLRAILTAGDP